MTTPKALHSKATPKWGTPTKIVELARRLLDGQIHLDPATSPEFNIIIKALLYYTEQDNGLLLDWAGNTFLNPPGGLVTEFWNKLMKSVTDGQVEKAFWIGFSVEQLCTLSDELYHPLDFSTCILRKRLSFNREDLSPGPSPAHGNYVTGIGVDKALFDELFSDHGRIVHGKLA